MGGAVGGELGRVGFWTDAATKREKNLDELDKDMGNSGRGNAT